MTKPMVLWLLGATVLFWAVGAYNRLVRLRSEVVKAFSLLDNVLSVQPALIKASQPLAADAESGEADPCAQLHDAFWARLEAVGEQFSQALGNARVRPLDPEAIKALTAAYGVLTEVWQAPGVEDLVGHSILDGLRARLAGLDGQARVPAATFDASVGEYNLAIRQFPALVLAAVWSFKPAGTLEWTPSAV